MWLITSGKFKIEQRNKQAHAERENKRSNDSKYTQPGL